MARYKAADNRILNTKTAVDAWTEKRVSDGRNMVSCVAEYSHESESLFLSRKGAYWVECISYCNAPKARLLTKEQATVWLAMCDHPIPEDLAATLTAVEE